MPPAKPRAIARRLRLLVAALTLATATTSGCAPARYAGFIGAGAIVGGGAGYGQSGSDNRARDATTAVFGGVALELSPEPPCS
ncbi:MAG: hypothetical protein K8W52_25360 [Deltaproteobacteria bacterium]|nr:hypothetical protein [Deltaproteobacteria bacterium]